MKAFHKRKVRGDPYAVPIDCHSGGSVDSHDCITRRDLGKPSILCIGLREKLYGAVHQVCFVPKDQPSKNVDPLYVEMGFHDDGGADRVAVEDLVLIWLALPWDTEDET